MHAARAHRSTHGLSVCLRTAFINKSCGILSKSPLISNSSTQSYRQHRRRVCASASCADRPGRYPYESGWKRGSTNGSTVSLTTVYAIRSATVGTPRIRTPPDFLGISTAWTGGGK